MSVRQSRDDGVLLLGVEEDDGPPSAHWESMCCTQVCRPDVGSLYLSHWLRELAAPWKG